MGHKIIIYDDDKDILQVTSVILQIKGFEVLTREHCRELEADLNGFQPNVILMDNWLPDMGGVKAIQFIKKLPGFANIPVVFFSANSNVEDLAREAGADYILKKPFEIDELQVIIGKAVGE
ncbi:MAG: response regulator [Chryseobacterium sp.]|nr:MAG: response regulator [Chryseobacterium sp.]